MASNYLRADNHKQAVTYIWESRRFELVHPVGKTRPTHRTHPTLSPHMPPDHTYLTRSTHINLSRSHQHSWTESLLLRKRAPDPIHSMMAYRSVCPYPVFLPRQSFKQWGQSQPSFDGWLLGLSGPYLRHVISMFNTFSRGSTHWFLIDIGGGYNFGGTSFPHLILRPF
jgi:hypothetical protein